MESMGKAPGRETTAASKHGCGAGAEKLKESRFNRPRPSKFERVSSDRFAGAEKQILELFGRNLREARHRAGLTQTDVANIVASSQPFVGAVERGEQNIKLSTLVRLAYAVRTDPGALLLGDCAASYSMETLVRLVGALHAHLQATVGEQVKNLPEGELLTLISSPPFQFNVTGGAAGDGKTSRRAKKG